MEYIKNKMLLKYGFVYPILFLSHSIFLHGIDDLLLSNSINNNILFVENPNLVEIHIERKNVPNAFYSTNEIISFFHI